VKEIVTFEAKRVFLTKISHFSSWDLSSQSINAIMLLLLLRSIHNSQSVNQPISSQPCYSQTSITKM